MGDGKFRAGDHVRHRPTGEEWVLAAVTGNGRVLPCGWPETLAEASDCELLTAATDEQHLAMVKEWLKPAITAESDIKYDHRRSLNKILALDLGLAEMIAVPCLHCKGTETRLRWQLKGAVAAELAAPDRRQRVEPTD